MLFRSSPATETDREEFRSYYPSSSPEEISARDATVVQLTSAIQFVVDKKENFTYTKESMEEVVSRTNSAVSAYKNFEYPSSYTDKLVIELLSETNSYFSLVLSSFDKLISLAGFTAIKYQGIIDSLEYRVTQLENG